MKTFCAASALVISLNSLDAFANLDFGIGDLDKLDSMIPKPKMFPRFDQFSKIIGDAGRAPSGLGGISAGKLPDMAKLPELDLPKVDKFPALPMGNVAELPNLGGVGGMDLQKLGGMDLQKLGGMDLQKLGGMDLPKLPEVPKLDASKLGNIRGIDGIELNKEQSFAGPFMLT